MGLCISKITPISTNEEVSYIIYNSESGEYYDKTGKVGVTDLELFLE
jgi:hypothetical protein